MLALIASIALRSLPAVLSLDDASFAGNRPFELEASVAAFLGNHTRVVLTAGEDKILADCKTPPPLGARLLARGETFVDRWGTKLLSLNDFDIKGTNAIPAPRTVSLADLGRKDLHLCRVSVSGIVEDVFNDETDTRWTFIVLRQGAHITHLTIPTEFLSADKAGMLPFAEVNALGVCFHGNLGHRLHFTQHICLSDGNDIRIRRPWAIDPFDVPPLRELYASGHEEIVRAGRRRHTGFVKATWDGNTFLLTVPDGPPCTATLETDGDLPQVGDTVTAVGTPETDLFTVNLTSVRWRREPTATAMPPDEPVDVTASELSYDERGEETFKSEWNGRRCRLRGTVRRLMANGVLLVDSDGVLLHFKASDGSVPLTDLTPGSTVEIVGVCTLLTRPWSPRAPFPHVRGYQFIVREAADIRVLSGPPWWTAKKFLILIGALLAALTGVFLWNRTLNRLATRRGRQLLKEQIAHERATLKIGERNRLAIELHDSLSQNLAAIACQITATQSALDLGPREAHASLNTAERMLLSCQAELRRCLWDLRGNALDEPDLTTALRKVLKPVAGTAVLHVRFNVPRRHLDDTTAHAVICIVRELVSNAVRHGQAAHVRVAGDLTDGILSFSVRDDGCGFDPKARPDAESGHFGLDGIRERVQRLGATFSLESSPATGTRAEITLPLPRQGGTST